jgi:hypothetical protein
MAGARRAEAPHLTDIYEHCHMLAEDGQDSDAMCPAEVCQIGERFPLLDGATIEPMLEVTL